MPSTTFTTPNFTHYSVMSTVGADRELLDHNVATNLSAPTLEACL